MKPWTAVLFDLDGTLADTVPLILASYRHTTEVHHGGALPDERWLRTLGKPLRVQLTEFVTADADVDVLAETYMAYQRVHHDAMVEAYRGVPEKVEALRAAGSALAVVTSKGREMAERTLAHVGLGGAFDAVVTAHDVERGKPDPEPVRLALERLGVPDAGKEALFVGDSPFDVSAGRRAGVRTGAALWGPFERAVLERERPDDLFSDVSEIPLGPGS